jgi:hypothetical protein
MKPTLAPRGFQWIARYRLSGSGLSARWVPSRLHLVLLGDHHGITLCGRKKPRSARYSDGSDHEQEAGICKVCMKRAQTQQKTGS